MPKRTKVSILWVFILSLLATASEGAETRVETMTLAFEAAAAEIDALNPSEWLYDRFPSAPQGFGPLNGLRRPAVAQRIGALEKLLNQEYPVPALARLLKHDNPRVRTLAVIALFDTEDPQVLPHLVELADDGAPTFPRLVPVFGRPILLDDPPKPPPPPTTKPQTVGDVARRAVDFYLKAAGYDYGIDGSRNNPGFDHYWEARHDRSWCTSWFAVQLLRATQGTTPFPGERMDQVREVRRRINQVPQPDRIFVLMALVREWIDGNASDAFITETALVEQAKQIDSEVWMAVLRRKPPTSDPDLQPSRQARYLEKVAEFILTHATDLLKPKYAEELLRISEEWQQAAHAGAASGGRLHRWITAAARLQPKKGIEWLKSSYQLFDRKSYWDRQTQLSIALWDIGGRPQIPFLVDWFYSLPVQSGVIPTARAQFIREVTRREKWLLDEQGEKRRIKRLPLQGAAGKDVKHLVAAIIRDRQFQDLDYYSVRELFITVNLWLEEPLVSIEQLYDSRSTPPLGLNAYYQDPKAVAEKYPEETEEFRKNLSGWRTLLRQSVPQWLPH